MSVLAAKSRLGHRSPISAKEPVGLWWSRREFGCARTDFADLRVHSGAMDQESAEIWTVQPNSQAGQPKSDRLLDSAGNTRALRDGAFGVQFGSDIGATNHVHLHACRDQLVGQLSVGLLASADHHTVDRQDL
jgi:hypothetical protein